MKRLTLTAACLMVACIASAALAGPLDPAHVPRDAKWVIHVDYEALNETAVVERIREQRPELVERIRTWLEERYGIDPREDLKGVTLFSDTYEAHTGAIILLADYDLEKVKSDLMSKSNVKTTEWEGQTLYTWSAEKRSRDGQHRGRDAGNADADDDAARDRSTERPNAQSGDTTITAALLDGEKAVFAPTPERVQSVVKLLQGDSPSLEGEDSKLISELPDGVIVYGAAVDLNEIARRDEAFPILQQHEHIRWVIGQRDGRIYEEGTLVAQDEEVARRMKTALEGLVALGQVWAADSKELGKLYEDVEITQKGETVRLEWQGEAGDIVAALAVLRDRIAHWGGDRRMRR